MAAAAAVNDGTPPTVHTTVFGMVSTAQDAERIEGKLFLLYGEKLTRKEKKKIETLEKKMLKDQRQKEKDLQAAKKSAAGGDGAAAKQKRGGREKPKYTYKAPPAGQKKDKNAPMPPSYDPMVVEDAWYSWWVEQGFFKPEYNKDFKRIPLQIDEGEADHFTMVIPPPNVTGSLHIGHALTHAIEDTLTRWNRMRGKVTLWNPGADHAGIATQTVVEKKLKRERNLTRHDLGREPFVQEIWKWKESYGSRIYEQMKRLGDSVDWDREAFTLSPRCSRAVQDCFIELRKRKLIYRSDRLVNWSCTLNSAISQIEVDKVELTKRTLMSVPGYDDKVEFGVMTSFAYKLDGSSDEEIVVATTRPETMLGDVAVAVHPQDSRYKSFVGRTLQHPFVDRKLVIVADDSVERDFGTGAVKITPAHDHNDFALGKRHDLPFITVIDKTGNICGEYGEFKGIKRFDARKLVIQRLKDKGLYRGDTDNPMVVPVCSRSKDIIEPLKVPQWFCDCQKMGARAAKAVRDGELKILPEMHKKTWFHWLDNIEDWCISRQLWWGHRIPAYFITVDDPSVPAGIDGDDHYWVAANSEEEARVLAADRFKVDKSKISLRQDEDVLDTWFSSGIYPISIFNWPEEEGNKELKEFYPGHLLETGHDILFFWVARMVMMCTELTGKLPFDTVYLHSLVRDAHGRKMSKSLGNVIDPMDVCTGITLEDMMKRLESGNLDPRELKRAKSGMTADFPNGIPECGMDALRFGLCADSGQGKDVKLDINVLFAYRAFCNKIWNATKLVLVKLGSDYAPPPTAALTGDEPIAAVWITSRLHETIASVNEHMKCFDFPKATAAIYNFIYNNYCNVFLEIAKDILKREKDNVKAIAAINSVMFTCLDSSLRLLSPFMPFVTEELWQRLPLRPNDTTESVCVASYPVANKALCQPQLENDFMFVSGVVNVARKCRQDKFEDRDRPTLYLRGTPEQNAVFKSWLPEIKVLVEVGKLSILEPKEEVPEGCSVHMDGSVQYYLLVKGQVDAAKEIEKLKSTLAETERALVKLQEVLARPGFDKAPENVQKKEKDRMAKCIKQREEMIRAIASFSS